MPRTHRFTDVLVIDKYDLFDHSKQIMDVNDGEYITLARHGLQILNIEERHCATMNIPEIPSSSCGFVTHSPLAADYVPR